MEYIQCPHCNKKYGINDKVRAAAGRTIACKGCGETFEIEIFETPSPSIPQTNKPVPEQEISADTKSTDKKEPESQNNNIKEGLGETQRKRPKRRPSKTGMDHKETKRFSPSMLLGIAIVILSVYAFYQDRSVDIGQPFVATESPKPSVNPSTQPSLDSVDIAPASEPEAPVHRELSEACKNIAAQQWVIDYTMMHGVPDSSEYTHSLDESVQNTAEIREKCGGPSIVQEVLASATEGTPPKWLEKNVSELITLDKETPHF